MRRKTERDRIKEQFIAQIVSKIFCTKGKKKHMTNREPKRMREGKRENE